jgi:hypothetical protein
MTLCYPLSYEPSVVPSTEAGGTLEKGTDACSTPAQDNTVVGEFRKTCHPQNAEVNEIRETSFQEYRTCEDLVS